MKQNITALTLALLGTFAAYSQVTLNTTPSRSVGTPISNSNTVEGFNSPFNTPNLVEGKELFNPFGIALDTSASPPILYVSDTGNNRVLGWKNATGFTNGQPADMVIGQQDFYATEPQGPGHKFSVGLWAPSGLAVNSSGDLYVVDTNNNRVLRFRTPFQHVSNTPAVLTSAPDLFIGQPSLASRTANFTGQVSAQGLSFKSNYPANLTFDSNGNLWICDVLNYRVLRFPASNLNATGGSISADIVIGQQSLTSTSSSIPSGSAGLQIKNQFALLAGIGFDPQGRLYVGDNLANSFGAGRVLVFGNPSAAPNNASADSLLGVFPPGTPNPTQSTIGATELVSPDSIFFIPDGTGNAYVGILDHSLNRATIFPPYAQWPAAPTPPAAVPPGGVIGQPSFILFGPNASTSTTINTPPASGTTLWGSFGAVFLSATKELFVADTNNNRVIVMPLQPQPTNPLFFASATRVLGQARFDQSSVNYIEGKEFQFTNGSSTAAGIALDTTGATPHLYVADTLNHRVLGFKDARLIAPNLHADIVLGQPDFGTALCNYPTGDPTKPSQASLCLPVGLAVDPQGNLYVADSANGRVLRFPAPFSYSAGGQEKADLVLGQQDFVTQVLDPTPSTMKQPYGLAFSGTNGLLVSDLAFNRVLYFKFTSNNTFAAGNDNGLAANKVYGQSDFFGVTSGNASTQLNSPHHIAADTSGRLYVADTSNNRIMIFDDPNSALTPTAGDSAPVSVTKGISTPLGVYVNQSTGEVWVANSGQGAVVRYPLYDTLSQNQASLSTITDVATDPEQTTGAVQYAPLATVQDQFGDLFVADNGNRIITYYQNLSIVNGASFLTYRLLAPNTIATIFPAINGSPTQFGSNTAQFSTVPVPTNLGDVQVTVNGTQASLFYVSPGQINFVIPWNAPTSGPAEVDVVQVSTQQVLGTAVVNMSSVSPGIFQCPPSTAALRQACILNEDNSVNSFQNTAQRGHVIQIFGTGQGPVSNAPPDGTPPSGGAPSSISPRVLINGLYPEQYQSQPGDPSNGQFVQYFGLAPGLVGVWQLNIQIPMAVTPGNNIPIEVNLNNVFDTDVNSGFHMSMAVK
jgi:uncharacterized protein (TIGR03437 family)